jgi:hypothetical protein
MQMYQAISIRRALTAIAISCVAAVSARAGLILTISTVMATPGSTGNSLQITLTNDDPTSSVDVAGFNFLIDSTTTDLNFTSAQFSTVFPYIFDGNSFDQDFAVPLNTSTGQSLAAGDSADNPPAFTVVGPGATFGLADVIFDVAADAMSGLDTILFDQSSANTSVSDPNGMAIPIDSFVNGGVLVNGGVSTPEPAVIWLMIGGLSFIAVWHKRRPQDR